MKQPHHILVTGAAGAIGSALSRQFAERFPSARLTLTDVADGPLSALAQELGSTAHAVRWDLTQVDALPAQWEAMRKERGAVDVLINCAGIMDILSISGTGWERGSRILAVNLLAPLRLVDLAVADMQRGACMINISSMAGRVPIKGCSYYGAAKAGIAMASEIAHAELKSRGIHVMTVYPGPVYSGLEAHARSQVKQGMISRFIPTGKPEGIAKEILKAYEKDTARVIYPAVYGVAHALNAIAAWVTANVSPEPLR